MHNEYSYKKSTLDLTEDHTFDEDDLFMVDTNYDQSLIGTCPPTIKAMMTIVQQVREQRTQHLAPFKYTNTATTTAAPAAEEENAKSATTTNAILHASQQFGDL